MEEKRKRMADVRSSVMIGVKCRRVGIKKEEEEELCHERVLRAQYHQVKSSQEEEEEVKKKNLSFAFLH
jgi:hypothetical protein